MFDLSKYVISVKRQREHMEKSTVTPFVISTKPD